MLKVKSFVLAAFVIIVCVLISGTATAAFYTIGSSVSYTSSTSVIIEQSGWYYIEAWGGNGGKGGDSNGSLGDGIGAAGGVSQAERGYFYFNSGDVLY